MINTTPHVIIAKMLQNCFSPPLTMVTVSFVSSIVAFAALTVSWVSFVVFSASFVMFFMYLLSAIVLIPNRLRSPPPFSACSFFFRAISASFFLSDCLCFRFFSFFVQLYHKISFISCSLLGYLPLFEFFFGVFCAIFFFWVVKWHLQDLPMRLQKSLKPLQLR